MTLKEEKAKRDKFLLEVYKEAKAGVPTSPTSAYFGLSKYKSYNMETGQFIANDRERGGYIIGERLGLNQTEVDSIVIYFSDRQVGYMSSTLGLGQFNITQLGVMYLESLEEEPYFPIQIHHNNISLGDHSTAQIQQNTSNSNQTQQINYTKENVKDLLTLLKADIARLNNEQTDELTLEIENALKQLDKGKDIKSRLLTIGEIVKDIGIEVFVSLASSPLANILKPLLGIPA